MINFKLKYIFVFVVAFVLAFSVSAYISYQSSLVKSQSHERYMLNILHGLCRDIEKRLDRSLDAALFLKNEIELHGPDDLMASFDAYAGSLLDKIDGITNLQLAPKGVISKIYPLEGHEAALGYSFMENDPRSSIAWDAYFNNQLIIIGPFELVQGGVGLVASAPVYADDNGEKTPWGFVTVLMLMDDFIEATQLPEIIRRGLEYDIAITDNLTGERYHFASAHYPEQTSEFHSRTIEIQNSSWEVRLFDTESPEPNSWIAFLISFIVSGLFATTVLWLFKQPETLRRIVDERTEQLKRQKDFQAELLDSIPISLVVTNTEGRILFSNEKYLSSKLNIQSNNDLEFINQTHNKIFNETASKSLSLNRELKESLLELDRQNYIELSLLKIRAKDSQNTDNYLWIIKDVSALQEANQALQELSSLRAIIFELIPDGLAYFDGKGVIKSFNANFVQHVTRLTQKKMTFSCVEIEEQLQHTAVVDGPVIHYTDIVNNQFDDESKSTVSQIVRSLNEKNKLLSKIVKFDRLAQSGGGLMLIRDVTEQVQMDELKSEFLSTAAHELRTPMANVFGYLELLLNQKIPYPQQHDILKIVFEEAERLSHILDDLLDLARIESKLSSSLNYRAHDFRQLIEDTLGKHSEYSKKHILKIDIADDIPQLMCDAEKIKQVIHNLMSNAEKYSEPNTTIVLSAKHELHANVSSIVFSVADEGVGMHPHDVEKIFDRFYRVDEHSDIAGTGLGMSIVKQVVELHRGDVSVVSEFGRGTTVNVWLPVDRRM